MGCIPLGMLTTDCGEGRKYPPAYAPKTHDMGTSLHTRLLIKNQRNQCLELTQVLLGGNSMTNTTSSASNTVFNFSNFSDQELVSWFIMFLNGADYTDPESLIEWEAATAEAEKRSDKVKQDIAYLREAL